MSYAHMVSAASKRDASLPPADAWVTEVLQSCAGAQHMPQRDLLQVLAPLSSAPQSAQAAPGSGGVPVGKVVGHSSRGVIDVDAEEEDAAGLHPVDVLAAQQVLSPISGGGAQSYQPYLQHAVRPAPTPEAQKLRAALSPAVLRKAYRLQLPCVAPHSTKSERMQNCAASPRCLAGLRTLGTDAVTRESCLAAIMGEGPRVLPLPAASTAGGSATAAAAVGSGGRRSVKSAGAVPSALLEGSKAGQKAPRAASAGVGETEAAQQRGAMESASDAAAGAGLVLQRTVVGDPSFPCLWRGVRNLMNTCYFSSVLQLVFSVAKLRQAILMDGAEDAQHPQQQETNSAAHPASAASPLTQLGESGLKELFALMAFSRAGAGADPHSFATYLSLDVKVQQDAQEFFTLLLDWLRCHCGPAVQSAVTNTFGGTLLYDRRCGACGRSAKRAEPFLYLSLPVRPSLEDSLSEFSKPESVDGFMCEGCGKTATATSRQYMRTLPDVLVVHWNRFEFDLQTLQRHKVTTATSFPLQLDMDAYMRQWHEQKRQAATSSAATTTTSNATNTAAAAAVAGKGVGVPQEEVKEDYRYELRGVVNHHGDTAVSGHYTYHGKVSAAAGDASGASASSSSSSAWLNFNDAEVTPLNRYQGQRGVSSDAYLLVYHRVCCPPASSAAAPAAATATDVDASEREAPASRQAAAVAPGAASAPTYAAPTPAEFPLYLQLYVDQVNQRCLDERQAWLEQRAQVARLYDLWATTAQAVFDPTAATASASSGAMYALPTVWLQQLGRLFFPPYVDVAALGGGVESELKRSKKDESRGGAGGGPASSGGATGQPNGPNSATAAHNEEENAAAGAAAALADAPADGVVVVDPAAATVGPRRHGYIQSVEEVYQLVRRHSLLQSLPSLQCRHGLLAPWGSYKLVSASAFAKLAHFLTACGAPLRAQGQTDTLVTGATYATATASGGDGDVLDAESLCAFTDANLCPLCVAAMAATVQHVAAAAAEDVEAELALTQAWQEAERKKDGEGADLADGVTAGPSHAALDGSGAAEEEAEEEGGSELVLVGEVVVEGWASYYAQQLLWGRVQQTEGFTGVVVMREARLSPPRPPKSSSSGSRSGASSPASPTSPASLLTTADGAALPSTATTLSLTLASPDDAIGISALNVDRGELDLTAQLLCPHGALRPGQHVAAVPASLRVYWMRRFAEVLTVAHRAGQLRTADAEWRVTAADVGHFLLPYIPASTTSTTCPECMRNSVQTITSRHHQRLRKMEERKKFPSLWLAGAMTSPAGIRQLLLATGAENEEQLLAAQHPNRLFFRHNAEKEYREFVKKWTEAQQARIAVQESEVARLQTTVAKKREHDAAWNARVTSRRGGRGGRGGPASPARSTPPSTAPAAAAAAGAEAPPDPETLEGRLFYAEATLARLRAQPVPDHDVAYGCVPTWWVARWYSAMQDEGPQAAAAASGEAGRSSSGGRHTGSGSTDALDGAGGNEEGGDPGSGGGAGAAVTARLPPLSFQKLKCPHGGCLLEVPWLNPSDVFWQGVRGKRAEVLWNGVVVERAAHGAPAPAADGQGPANSSSAAAGPGKEDYRPQCWLPPLVILPMEEYLTLLAQYGAPDMLEMSAPAALPTDTTAVTTAAAGAAVEAAKKREESDGATVVVDVDAEASSASTAAQPSLAAHHVIQIGFHNGVRQLHPSPCPECCATLLANFEDNCETFVNGSLKLNLHIKKSRKNFYDAVTVLTSAAVQQSRASEKKASTGAAAAAKAAGSHAGVPITVADTPINEDSNSEPVPPPCPAEPAGAIADGIHHYTTLAQLRGYISTHLREKHGYLVQPQDLQIARGKNKPLKLRAAAPASSAAAVQPAEDAAAAALELATLHELGIRDGETLSVQSVDVIAQTCATAAGADEEWEAIPPELLQASSGSGAPAHAASLAREHYAAFRETRLQGSTTAAGPSVGAVMGVVTGSSGGGGAGGASPAAGASARGGAVAPAEEQSVACAVCTFLNAPGMVVCEMCEAPLPAR